MAPGRYRTFHVERQASTALATDPPLPMEASTDLESPRPLADRACGAPPLEQDGIPRMTRTGQTSIEKHPVVRLADMEADLAALQRELEHTHRLATLGTIAALSAHEINNVLTAAIGHAQLARSRSSDPDHLSKVIERLETAAHIAGAMLDFAGLPEAGAGGDEPHGVEAGADVNVALNGALDCLGRDPAKDGIRLVREIAGDAIPRIQALAFQQILLNLLLNARRALSGQGGRITISALRTPASAVHITVADDGPGIPPEIADSLFEPFVSRTVGGGPRRTDEAIIAGGSGLGLTVCRRLVESAGGTISAQTAPGGGAAFTIELPAAEASSVRRAS